MQKAYGAEVIQGGDPLLQFANFSGIVLLLGVFVGVRFGLGLDLVELLLLDFAPEPDGTEPSQRQHHEKQAGKHGPLHGIAPAQILCCQSFRQQIDAYGHSLKSRQGGANGHGQLQSDMFYFDRLLARQSQLQEAGGIPSFAVQQQFRMKHL